MEQLVCFAAAAVAQWLCEVREHRVTTGAFAKDRDRLRIAAEGADALFDPREGQPLVGDSILQVANGRRSQPIAALARRSIGMRAGRGG